jgi:membrane associated rhomboid family serine protease
MHNGLAATKAQLLMFMIACFVSGGLAFGLSVFYGSTFFIYSIPGLVVGAFFAFKYSVFDKNKARQEEHKRRRNRH